MFLHYLQVVNNKYKNNIDSMKYAFRFKYNSISDYIGKTAISFFYIPYINRMGLNIPLEILKFETNQVLFNLYMTDFLLSNSFNTFLSPINFKFTEDFKFEIIAVLNNSELLEKLKLIKDIGNLVIFKL